jgi:DNA-binding beta-propeller fold protein YncE
VRRAGGLRLAGLLLGLAAGPAWSAAPPPSLHLQATLDLGAPDKWKYVLFDPASKDLLIAHGTEITVVDPAIPKVVGHVVGLSGARAAAVDAGDHGFATSGRTDTVAEFDLRSFRKGATIQAGRDPTAIVYDPASARLFVMNDDASTITLIDPKTDAPAGLIALGGDEGVEAAAIDGRGHLFVDHSASDEVVRIDTLHARIDARWQLPTCGKMQGLAVAPKLGRIFVGCGNGLLLALNADTGRQLASLPIGQGSGAVLWDPARRRLYSANADATVSVIDVEGPDRFTPLAPVKTRPGARTGAVDPLTGRVFLVGAGAGGTAELLVYVPESR